MTSGKIVDVMNRLIGCYYDATFHECLGRDSCAGCPYLVEDEDVESTLTAVRDYFMTRATDEEV